MQTITVEDLRVTAPGEHLPTPVQKGQQHVYIQSGGYIFEVESVTPVPSQATGRSVTERILFGALPDPRVRIRKPIPIEIANFEGTYTASSAELEEFGYGHTRSQALDDLGRTLSELYFSLADQRQRLSEHLTGIQAKLSEYIELRLKK